MSKPEDLFHSTHIDEQIEALSREPGGDNSASSTQLISNLRQVHQEDREIIDQVWARLAARGAAKRGSGVEHNNIQGRPSRTLEKDRQKEFQPMQLATSKKRSPKPHKRLLEMLAAVILAGIIVGSMIVIFKVRPSAQAHSGASPKTPVAQPTVRENPGGLYLSTQSGIDKISLQTGHTLWHIPLYSAGQPFVIGNIVFFAHEVSNDYYLEAVNATTGKQLWRKNYGSSTFLLQAHGILYDSSCVPASKSESGGCYIYAINPANGAKIWSFATFQGTAWITIQDNVVYGASYTHLFALNAATGKPLWQKTLSYPQQEITITPLVLNHTIYATSCNATKSTPDYSGCYFLAFSTTNGSVLWHTSVNIMIGTSLASANGVLYYGSGGEKGLVYAVNASTGSILWTYTACSGGCGIRHLAAEQNTLYIQISSQNSPLLALDLTNRSVLWSKNQAPYYGESAIFYQGLIYIITNTSQVQALDTSKGTVVKSYTDATETITGFTLVIQPN